MGKDVAKDEKKIKDNKNQKKVDQKGEQSFIEK